MYARQREPSDLGVLPAAVFSVAKLVVPSVLKSIFGQPAPGSGIRLTDAVRGTLASLVMPAAPMFKQLDNLIATNPDKAVEQLAIAYGNDPALMLKRIGQMRNPKSPKYATPTTTIEFYEAVYEAIVAARAQQAASPDTPTPGAPGVVGQPGGVLQQPLATRPVSSPMAVSTAGFDVGSLTWPALAVGALIFVLKGKR